MMTIILLLFFWGGIFKLEYKNVKSYIAIGGNINMSKDGEIYNDEKILTYIRY